MQNLRDKLLKAGLVTEDQIKKSETETSRRKERPAAPPPPKGGPPPRNEAARPKPEHPPQRQGGQRPGRPAEDSRIPKLPPLPGSKAAQRLESKKQLELDRKLRELVHAHQVPVEPGARTFYFVTRKGRLRRLEVSEEQAKLLESGQLAVVERPEPAQIEHSLVPPQTAEQMLALSVKAVRFFNRSGSPVGFLSDEELKHHQEAERNAGPEDTAEAREPSEADEETDAPAQDADGSSGSEPSGGAAGA